MKLSNAAVAAVYSTAFVITLSFLPEASAIPRGREAYYKWSPRYFYSPRGDEIDEPDATSYISEIPQRVVRYGGRSSLMNRGRFEGSLGTKSPGFAGFGSGFALRKRSYPKEDSASPSYEAAAAPSCLTEGQTCVYRPSLAAAPIKSECCGGASCVFIGNSFSCISNIDVLTQNDEYDMEGILGDALDSGKI